MNTNFKNQKAKTIQETHMKISRKKYEQRV